MRDDKSRMGICTYCHEKTEGSSAICPQCRTRIDERRAKTQGNPEPLDTIFASRRRVDPRVSLSLISLGVFSLVYFMGFSSSGPGILQSTISKAYSSCMAQTDEHTCEQGKLACDASQDNSDCQQFLAMAR